MTQTWILPYDDPMAPKTLKNAGFPGLLSHDVPFKPLLSRLS